MAFFTELDPKILKFVQRHKRPQIAKAILTKKNRAGGIRLPDFRLYYKATVIKTAMVLAQKEKYRPMEQDRKPEINPRTYGHLIYDKGGKTTMEKRQSLQ